VCHSSRLLFEQHRNSNRQGRAHSSYAVHRDEPGRRSAAVGGGGKRFVKSEQNRSQAKMSRSLDNLLHVVSLSTKIVKKKNKNKIQEFKKKEPKTEILSTNLVAFCSS
jgi:hypothetical protein